MMEEADVTSAVVYNNNVSIHGYSYGEPVEPQQKLRIAAGIVEKEFTVNYIVKGFKYKRQRVNKYVKRFKNGKFLYKEGGRPKALDVISITALGHYLNNRKDATKTEINDVINGEQISTALRKGFPQNCIASIKKLKKTATMDYIRLAKSTLDCDK